MSTVQLTLTPELDAFVQSQIAAGRFHSVEEAIGTSLQLLVERTRTNSARIELLRTQLAEASVSPTVGPVLFDEIDLLIDEVCDQDPKWQVTR